MQIDRTKEGYRLRQTINGQSRYYFLSMDEAFQLSQRFDRDFEQDANVEEIQYQAEMVRRAKVIRL